ELGLGRAAAQDLLDPLVLVVLQAQLLVGLLVVGSGDRLLHGVERRGHADGSSCSVGSAGAPGTWGRLSPAGTTGASSAAAAAAAAGSASGAATLSDGDTPASA